VAPEAQSQPTQKQSLEDLLAGLDDTARTAILGEVSKARGEAANYRSKLREAEPKLTEYDRLIEASKSELERAQEKANTEAGRAQALLQRAVAAEVKAVASQGFADPEDAAAFLDLTKYANADGDIDADAIRNDLADLLSRKPHLGKSPTSRVPAPNPAQGSSGSGPANPAQLTEADVKRMYAAKDYAGIEQARQEGRLANVLGA
jgi:hypothetical protein